MQPFPILVALTGRVPAVSGRAVAAVAKLRFLLKTGAESQVYAQGPAPAIVDWAVVGRLAFRPRPPAEGDTTGAVQVHGANQPLAEDARTATRARAGSAAPAVLHHGLAPHAIAALDRLVQKEIAL